MEPSSQNIFQRLLSGEAVPFSDSDYGQIRDECTETLAKVIVMNSEPDAEKRKNLLEEILGEKLQEGSGFFPSFQINYGKNLKIGRNVFINSGFTCLDLGGVTIEDDVLIAPNVTISSEGHPVEPGQRKILTGGQVTIKTNVWIGSNATILPGVTIGENSIVAAGAVVSKEVPPNVVVGGIPAKIIKNIDAKQTHGTFAGGG